MKKKSKSDDLETASEEDDADIHYHSSEDDMTVAMTTQYL